METDGDGGTTPREVPTDDAAGADMADTAEEMIKTGAKAGNRSGGLAFLALMVVLGAAVHFYLTGTGSGSFPSRLDTQLLTHAELAVASMKEGGRMELVPSWPAQLYAALRRDIALYALFLAAAALFWGMSVRARARRDAYLVHDKLSREIQTLREQLEGRAGTPAAEPESHYDEMKGS